MKPLIIFFVLINILKSVAHAGPVLNGKPDESNQKNEREAAALTGKKSDELVFTKTCRMYNGHEFGIQNSDESIAHTACLGFGLERVTLALIRTHGFDPESWPEAVRSKLWP